MKLRLILGDQLNLKHSWYSTHEEDTLYVMYELNQEATYVVHHIQKIVAFFSAMQGFASDLRAQGHQVLYFDINSIESKKPLKENIMKLIDQKGIEKFEYQLPDEYRMDQQLNTIAKSLDIPQKALIRNIFLLREQT